MPYRDAKTLAPPGQVKLSFGVPGQADQRVSVFGRFRRRRCPRPVRGRRKRGGMESVSVCRRPRGHDVHQSIAGPDGDRGFGAPACRSVPAVGSTPDIGQWIVADCLWQRGAPTDEEIWVRQLGAWLDLPAADSANFTLLCSEALHIAERLQKPAAADRQPASAAIQHRSYS